MTALPLYPDAEWNLEVVRPVAWCNVSNLDDVVFGNNEVEDASLNVSRAIAELI